MKRLSIKIRESLSLKSYLHDAAYASTGSEVKKVQKEFSFAFGFRLVMKKQSKLIYWGSNLAVCRKMMKRKIPLTGSMRAKLWNQSLREG